jgi:DNA-binding SARP family transcriptional activator
VSSERLVTLLWDHGPGDARGRQATLRSHVSHLRKLLASDGDPYAPTVTRTSSGGASGYVLTTPSGRLDASRFEALLGAGRAAAARGDTAGALARHRDALRLWRGTPFGELHRLPFVAAEGRRLLELRSAAEQGLLAARLSAGQHAEILDDLTGLVAAHPRRVEPRRMLVTVLARVGRHEEALATCRAGLALLAADGVVSPVLESLLHELQGTSPGRPRDLAR